MAMAGHQIIFTFSLVSLLRVFIYFTFFLDSFLFFPFFFMCSLAFLCMLVWTLIPLLSFTFSNICRYFLHLIQVLVCRVHGVHQPYILFPLHSSSHFYWSQPYLNIGYHLLHVLLSLFLIFFSFIRLHSL